MKLYIIAISVFSILYGQNYTWPTDLGKDLSSNFGEFRSTGYHIGIDMKTKGTVGHPIYAISDGHISRIVSNFAGFGKALYLKLDDGNTAVYAHLSKFTPLLERRLKRQQKKSGSYFTNIYPKPNEFIFKKGDIIAYSGNTGFSFGPHLHFELRNKDNQPINPLTNGLVQPDRLAPFVNEISFIPLNDASWINGNQLPQNFPLFRDVEGNYNFPDTINVYGKFGISLFAFDKREGANNVYQPHRVELFLDNKLYHALEFERLDYSWQSTSKFVIDYRNKRLNLGNFIKLYRNDNDPKIPIHSDSTTGIIEKITPGYHDIRIVVLDAKKNMRTVKGTIFFMEPFDITVDPQQQDNSTVSFVINPRNISIPLKSVTAYSFTPFGFAEKKVKILSQESSGIGLKIKIPIKEVTKRGIQFIAENKIGTSSTPNHWIDTRHAGDFLTTPIDFEISHTDAGVYVQFQPEEMIDADVELRLKGEYQYITIPINQIQPSVYLSKPISPLQFQNIDQIEAIVKNNIERSVLFKFPYQVAYRDTKITLISNDGNCSIRTQKNSFLDPTLIWVEAVHKHAPVKKGNLVSRVYQLQPFDRPLLNPVNIAIRYPRKYKDNFKKIHLYNYDSSEGWSYIKSNINTDRKVILGEVKHLDAIAIIEDNVNPVIKKIYPDQNGRYASLELRKFEAHIDDNLSGFEPNEKSFTLILNGEPQIYSFQPKTKKIKYELDRPLKIGEHQLEIEIKDRAENITKKNIQFIVY